MDIAGSDDVRSIVWNIVGGAIVAVGTMAVSSLWRKVRYWRFRRVFGQDVDSDVYLKYCVYEPPSRQTVFSKPLCSVDRNTPNATNLTSVASVAGIRGIAYLAHAFGSSFAKQPIIEPDNRADERMDISFIALGLTAR